MAEACPPFIEMAGEPVSECRNQLRANSDLKSSEYSTPVLGLIFLKFADNKYRQHEKAGTPHVIFEKLVAPKVSNSLTLH